MSRSIIEYIPIKTKDYMLVQGRVARDITAQVKKIMDKENLSWSDILTACLKHFLDEKSAKGVSKR